MNIKAVPFSKFFKNKENIYKNIMILSKRARQIINERYEEMSALNNIEDSEELVEFDSNIDHDQEKSISIAMEELLNNDLEYRSIKEDNEEGDQ
jgi:DNA-directed RNA polymerase subunit K/omega